MTWLVLFVGVLAIAVAIALAVVAVRSKPDRSLASQAGDVVARAHAQLNESAREVLGPGNPIKTYIYVSDVKVDMLYEQLDEARRAELTQELKLDAKLISYGITVSPAPSVTRYARLAAVLRQLESQEAIGSHDSESLYFGGSLPMKHGRHQISHQGPHDVVLFTGMDQAGHLVALGGTAHHLIGSVGDRPWSNSGVATLMQALRRASQREIADEDRLGLPGGWDAEAFETWETEPGPPQRVEFIAVRLAVARAGQDLRHYDVILGSPIYVALA